MSHQSGSIIERYSIAVATVLAAFLVRLVAVPRISSEVPYILLATAVIVSTWFGGFGPGILTTIFCALLAGFVRLTPNLALT